MEEIDFGSFFDHIDDIIEFPADNDGSLSSGDSGNDFPAVWHNDSRLPDPIFSGGSCNAASDLSAELDVPYEDILQLEWLSNFMEDSFSSGGGMILETYNSSNSNNNNFCSSEKAVPLLPHHSGPQRARTKRPRPPTFSPRPAIPLLAPASSIPCNPQPLKKKKKTKIASLCPESRNLSSQSVRKCMHCEITKTPQWRSGPMGPKTLCNACGVRYKSGRLFPEYRPAASPTFVPSLHSNSHKKVIEIRNKDDEGGGQITKSAMSNNPLVECI